MISCIYKISSTRTTSLYVGSASNFHGRRHSHSSELRNNKHGNKLLQCHVNKYGIDDLAFEILEAITDKQQLIPREQYFIDLLNPDLNICRTAGNRKGYKFSEESKNKISVANKGRKHSEANKILFGLVNKGKQFSAETKAKMSEAAKSRQYTDADKKRMSEGQLRLGRKISQHELTQRTESYKINKALGLHISRAHLKPMLGLKHTEESKIKMSLAAKGKKKKPFSEDHKLKLAKVLREGRMLYLLSKNKTA